MKKALAALFAALGLAGCAGGASPRTITPAEAKAMLDGDETVILVDVRTAEEYDAEHIPGAILLPLDDLEADAGSVLPDKDAIIIVYCRSGNRSGQAAALLDQLGYTHVNDLGGIIDWPYATVTG